MSNKKRTKAIKFESLERYNYGAAKYEMEQMLRKFGYSNDTIDKIISNIKQNKVDIYEVIPSDRNNSVINSIRACECNYCGGVFTLRSEMPNKYDELKNELACPLCGHKLGWHYISITKFKFVRYWRGLKENFYKFLMRKENQNE